VARVLGGVQVKEPPVASSTRTSTVFRLPLGPVFRVMVTGPEAPDQVILKGWPAITLYSLLVKMAALTRAARAATMRGTKDNFILAGVIFSGEGVRD